jgi:hypothetical protein
MYKRLTHLASSNNLLIVKIIALQSRDEVADIILNMQNILAWGLLAASPSRVAEVVHLRESGSA